MPRPYEVVYIFDSSLEDAAIADKLTRFHGMLGANGAARPTSRSISGVGANSPTRSAPVTPAITSSPALRSSPSCYPSSSAP